MKKKKKKEKKKDNLQSSFNFHAILSFIQSTGSSDRRQTGYNIVCLFVTWSRFNEWNIFARNL